jgi:hypothetical protein
LPFSGSRVQTFFDFATFLDLAGFVDFDIDFLAIDKPSRGGMIRLRSE